MSRAVSLLALATLLWSDPQQIAVADEWILPGQPSLYSQLTRFQDSSFPINRQLPSEAMSCEFYNSAAVDFVLPNSKGEPAAYLVSIPTDFAGYHLFPNIVSQRPDGTWVRTPVPKTFDGWTHVHQSEDRVRVLLLMDNVPDSPGGNTHFLFSDDSGVSWRYISEINLYAYFHVITHFGLDDDGIGIAVEYNDGSTDGYEKAGYYLYRTRDWAQSWSDPEFVQFFDVTGLTDVVGAWRKRRDSRWPFRDLKLDSFAECSQT